MYVLLMGPSVGRLVNKIIRSVSRSSLVLVLLVHFVQVGLLECSGSSDECREFSDASDIPIIVSYL